MTDRPVQFFLDPVCPWTWLTSRWLAEVAEARDLEVRWRPFSLAHLNGDGGKPRSALADRTLRVIAVLHEAGRHTEAGEFYREFGERFHVVDGEPGDGTVDDAARAAGVSDALDEADDPRVDALVGAALDEAVALAGPDVGSPVLHIGDGRRGLFGPIVSPAPTGEPAVALFDAVALLQDIDSFFEVKRGRNDPPDI